MTSSWLKTPNKILVRQRLLEILVDYFVIVAYLLCLAMVAAIVYGLILDGIPAFSLWQSQLFVTVVSVVPVVVVFAYLDFREKSFGKRAAKLSLHFKTKKFWRSLVRNSVKFMPWQLAHMGVLHTRHRHALQGTAVHLHERVIRRCRQLLRHALRLRAGQRSHAVQMVL